MLLLTLILSQDNCLKMLTEYFLNTMHVYRYFYFISLLFLLRIIAIIFFSL